MFFLTEPALSEHEVCPYLEQKKFRYQFFLAYGLSETDLGTYLKRGWRKFGDYFFRPRCPGCSACRPLRVPIGTFSPTRSQRRVLRRGKEIEVKFLPLKYREEIFRMYLKHSRERFEQESDRETFLLSHYVESCPTLQSEYFLDGKLVGVGFLDRCRDGLSSSYYVYDPAFEKYSLGTLSVLREIDYARGLGLRYYYLGYYIRTNHHMAYKGQFRPHQRYSWKSKRWRGVS